MEFLEVSQVRGQDKRRQMYSSRDGAASNPFAGRQMSGSLARGVLECCARGPRPWATRRIWRVEAPEPWLCSRAARPTVTAGVMWLRLPQQQGRGGAERAEDHRRAGADVPEAARPTL